MWEKIGASSGIVIGAVVLFLLFALVLFIIERDEHKERSAKRTAPYLVPKQKYTSTSRDKHQHNQRNAQSAAYYDIKVRKIS